MVNTITRKMFPDKYARLEQKRQEAVSRPLTVKEVETLLNIHFAGEPQFQLEDLFSEEWKGICGLRPMTDDEAQKLSLLRAEDGSPKYRPNDLMPFPGLYAPLSSVQATEIYDIGKLERYRPATRREANLLYCDIHSKWIL